MAKKKFARECTACSVGMNEGYCIGDGMEHYCSDACLYLHMTPAEYLKLYADGEGDSYWTAWEDPDDFEDEDEDEVDTYHARDCSVPELTAEVERLREENKRLTRIAVALRRAYELVEEGSEAQGYIAEALAYADGDMASFDGEV